MHCGIANFAGIRCCESIIGAVERKTDLWLVVPPGTVSVLSVPAPFPVERYPFPAKQRVEGPFSVPRTPMSMQILLNTIESRCNALPSAESSKIKFFEVPIVGSIWIALLWRIRKAKKFREPMRGIPVKFQRRQARGRRRGIGFMDAKLHA